MKVLERALIERIAELIHRHGMFAHARRAGVAVSGGADSVCLLHVLRELAPELELRVLHLDHGLRGEESRADAEFVRRMAADLGLECHAREVDVAARGQNLEQAARRARQEFFLEFLRNGTVDRVATGHTLGDQAETVLFRLLRGAGTAGLAGIWPVTAEGIVRPLLGVTRPEVEAFLSARKVPWREDSSNRNRNFSRNRIRHDLLPALGRDWNPCLPLALARLATLAQDEERYWKSEIERLAGERLTLEPPAVLLRAAQLAALPTAVARRLVRYSIETAKGDLRRLDFEHVERILALAARPQGHGQACLPGVEVRRSFDWLRLTPAGDGSRPGAPYRVPLTVPGRAAVPGTGAAISLDLIDAKDLTESGMAPSGYNENGSYLDGEIIPAGLELRNWEPGDRYQPHGSDKEHRVKLLFHRDRVPSWERPGWPMIKSGSVIVWARGFGAAARYAATPASRVIVEVRETEISAVRGNRKSGFQRLTW